MLLFRTGHFMFFIFGISIFWHTASAQENEGGSISGTLLMLDDVTPHVAVPVEVIANGKVISTTKSDESGKYRFENFKPGRYRVRCQVLGGYVYYPTTEEATGEDVGEVLRIFLHKPLSGVDFHVAPFKKGRWQTYTPVDGLADNSVQSIYRSPEGVLWIGTDVGVSRYDGDRFVNLTTQDGLAHNGI